MQSTFSLVIMLPSGEAFCGDLKHMQILSTDGSIGILASHARMFVSLKEGPLTLTLPDNTVRTCHLQQGLLKVDDNAALILTHQVTFEP